MILKVSTTERTLGRSTLAKSPLGSGLGGFQSCSNSLSDCGNCGSLTHMPGTCRAFFPVAQHSSEGLSTPCPDGRPTSSAAHVYGCGFRGVPEIRIGCEGAVMPPSLDFNHIDVLKTPKVSRLLTHKTAMILPGNLAVLAGDHDLEVRLHHRSQTFLDPGSPKCTDRGRQTQAGS